MFHDGPPGCPKAYSEEISRHNDNADDPLERHMRRLTYITLEVAESVLFNTLNRLGGRNDLFMCATVNRGFYRVFKRNEHSLVVADFKH